MSLPDLPTSIDDLVDSDSLSGDTDFELVDVTVNNAVHLNWTAKSSLVSFYDQKCELVGHVDFRVREDSNVGLAYFCLCYAYLIVSFCLLIRDRMKDLS